MPPDFFSTLPAARPASELVPICAVCHQIRDAAGHWHQAPPPPAAAGAVRYTHTYCPDCLRAWLRDAGLDAADLMT
ncbi:MAG TPA: hypothetical protein VF607_05740 [Verrucomicrobiae bacterium]